MNPSPLLRCAGLAGLLWTSTVLAISPAPQEMQARDAWLRQHVTADAPALPSSLTLDGHSLSADELAGWPLERASSVSSSGEACWTIQRTDPATGVRARWEVRAFADQPAVEWLLHLENTRQVDAPRMESVQALDAELPSGGGAARLHYARGATCSMADYEPLTLALAPGARLHLEPGGGRSSSDFLPFFNVEQAPRGGMLIGLGWSGQWAANFEGQPAGTVRVQAGMADTHWRLRPGESVRTPSVALVFYEGDAVRGQNLWRRFVLAAHRPRVAGRPLEGLLLSGNWGATPAAMHLANIERIVGRNLPLDVYWIDAEWFGQGPWYQNAGDWRVKADLYPQGFRPLSDALRPSQRRLLLWFEPERVCETTPWASEHAEWLLALPPERRSYRWGDKQTYPDWVKAESLRNQILENDRLFNLAIPEAREFLTDFISEKIDRWGLGCYRHDANIAPLEFWRAADAPERRGITEVRWVEGLYAFWDALLLRHPELIIDNCASGGRRIDLETLSRSTPFWRTDFPGNVTGKQCHQYGISSWVPLNATGAVTPGRDSQYAWQSTWSSSMVVNLFGNGDAAQAQPPDEAMLDRAAPLLAEYRRMQPYYLGDYYPLTPYTVAEDAWMAWQFHRDDLSAGLVQVFRRPGAVQNTLTVSLCGLSDDATYAINQPEGPPRRLTGRQLREGFAIPLPQAPASAVLEYRRVAE